MKVVDNLGMILKKTVCNRTAKADRNDVNLIVTCFFLDFLNKIVKLIANLNVVAE